MAHHLTDEVMNRVVPQGTYQQIPDILAEWYSGLCTARRSRRDPAKLTRSDIYVRRRCVRK